MAAESYEEPAEKRTDLALSRTVLTVERAYNSWIKTAIGFLAGGLGLAKLMSQQLTGMHGAAILASAVLLVIVAGVVSAYATHRYRQRMDQLGEHALGRWPLRVILFISSSFTIVCVVGLICLFLL